MTKILNGVKELPDVDSEKIKKLKSDLQSIQPLEKNQETDKTHYVDTILRELDEWVQNLSNE